MYSLLTHQHIWVRKELSRVAETYSGFSPTKHFWNSPTNSESAPTALSLKLMNHFHHCIMITITLHTKCWILTDCQKNPTTIYHPTICYMQYVPLSYTFLSVSVQKELPTYRNITYNICLTISFSHQPQIFWDARLIQYYINREDSSPPEKT